MPRTSLVTPILRFSLRIILAALAFLVLSAPAARAQALSDAVPNLSKDQKKALDGPGRNAYKHCGGDTGKHRGETIAACINLAPALRTQLKDPADARQALARACALGGEAGCTELGKDYVASGDLVAARAAWSAPACTDGTGCKNALFESYASATPVDLPNAERVGLSACDNGGDEDMCRRLYKLGSKQNFAAIMQRHSEQRQAKISELTQTAESNEASAASDKEQYESLDAQAKAQNGTPDGLGAAMKALVYASSYHSEEKAANAAREQIRELKSQDMKAHLSSSNPWNQASASASVPAQ